MTTSYGEQDEDRYVLTFTGKNFTEVRAWYQAVAHCPGSETWVLNRASSTPTGNQAWRYVKNGDRWPNSVGAAIYAPVRNEWMPLAVGDSLILQGGCIWHGGTMLVALGRDA